MKRQRDEVVSVFYYSVNIHKSRVRLGSIRLVSIIITALEHLVPQALSPGLIAQLCSSQKRRIVPRALYGQTFGPSPTSRATCPSSRILFSIPWTRVL